MTPPDPLKARAAACLENAGETCSLHPASHRSGSSGIPSDREPPGHSSKEGARETSTTEHEAAEGLGSAEGTDKEKDLPLLGLAPG